MILKRTFKENLYAFYFFGKDKLISFITQPPKVISNNDTIDKIIEDKSSVSRFGDGELHLLMQTKDLKFQRRSNELSTRLMEILISNEENLLICIPKIFSNSDLKVRTKQSRHFWKDHLANYRLVWYKHLNPEKVYYSSTFTRNYIAMKEKSKLENYFENLKKIWDKRDLLIIEGEFSRFGVGNNLLNNAKSICRILAPNENAFEKYEQILNEAIKYSKDKLILIALGPTATILAYDLHKIGYQAIDIGHLDVEFEWYLQKTTIRTKIENKYVIEANNRIIDFDDFRDEKYEKQIVSKIF